MLKCVGIPVAAALLAALLTTPALAHTPSQPPHQSYKIGDLTLESGEAIKDFSISYVTHGTLNAKKSNAILMVTAISGNHHRLDFLIGPGKSLDPTKYFIICTDAIGNGLTTSPSNSAAQPHMRFPKFLIRDMVTSQKKLLEHLGVDHVVAVIGPSMGGMQTLQWGVSHPDAMDALIAIVPLAKTPAWTVTVLEATRKAIMLDPAWRSGDYAEPPEQGIRLWRDILNFLAARSPEVSRDQFANQMDMLPYLQTQETGLIKAFDANDWIYQTWAYDRHDVGTTPGMNGDTREGTARHQGEDADHDRHQGPAESGVGAAGRRALHPRRARRHHQPRHRDRPRLGGRRLPGRRRFPQPRNLRIPRSGHRSWTETELTTTETQGETIMTERNARNRTLLASVAALLIASATTPALAQTAPSAGREIPARMLPVPETVSPQVQKVIAAPLSPTWNVIPGNAEDWKTQVNGVTVATMQALPALREALRVTVEPTTIDGVKAFIVTPESIPPENQNRVLVHVHGGCFVSFPGESGTVEAVYMAGFGKFKVISVDYRMPPDHPYPAALDDAITVWKAMVKTNDPKKMAIFGSSAGGALTLSMVHRAKKEKPAAPGRDRAGHADVGPHRVGRHVPHQRDGRQCAGRLRGELRQARGALQQRP